MPFFQRTCAALALAFGVSLALHAQWLNYPTPGVPRLPNGKVDLAAKTPRTSDGRPDFSGVWQRGRPPRPPVRQPVSGSYENWLAADSKIEMLPDADLLFKRRLANGGAGSPPERCFPRSFQHQILIGEPFQIIQGVASTTVLFEEFNHYRQIFTDGRSHPDERTPSWFGYSVGKWDGDSLIVETIGFRNDTWLDLFGHPATEKLRTIERYSRPDFGHLKLTITFEDSGVYLHPWSADVDFQFQPDTDLFEHICENEKSSQHISVK